MHPGLGSADALGPDQRLLVGTVERLVADHPTPASAPLARVDPDLAAWAAMVATGLHALRAPAAGASLLDAALVAETLARGPLPVPFLATQLAIERALDLGDEEALAAIEAGAPATVVVDRGLVAPAADGFAVDAVPGSVVAGGATLGDAVDGVDLTRTLVVARDGSPVPSSERWSAVALTLVAADLVGTMVGALELAVAHAVEREQFGRPIGSFQAVQHLLADQLVSAEAARAAVRRAADRSDLATARVAKAYASEVAVPVTEAVIQVLGGIGMTWECPAHRYLRRALLSRQLLGDEAAQWDAIAADLLDEEVPA